MYADGKQPFGPVPFVGLDELLRRHVPRGGKVLDIGAGYGRDALWLARELGCAVTALEPGQHGVSAMTAAVAEGKAEPGSLQALCACASEFDYDGNKSVFDAVLVDSVLQFVSAELQPALIRGACQVLTTGGCLVIIGWPNEDAPKWVSRMIRDTDVEGLCVEMDAEHIECDAEFDGEMAHMTWAVTVAKREQ
eukprot:gb/GFBE01060238.1/.p1 GENE.gb/GFBE01060238.1/~~gb/GFBE01060238.1/.p1  ORF type:complete len:193 (+),score=35.24 gb/GFBE01060238.1/:1-579(+)